VQPAVKLDGVKVGNAVPYGFFHIETAPGLREVSVTTEMTHKATIPVSHNKDTYVRLNMMMGLFVGHVVPVEVPQEKAIKDMENLHLVNRN
jgi:hypothetical protein